MISEVVKTKENQEVVVLPAQHTRFLTIDLGNFFLVSNAGISIENRYVINNQRETLGAETITVDGKTYFFGEGTFDKEYNKTAKEFIPALLYLIDKSTRADEVDIIMGLPIIHMSLKDKFIEALQGQTFTFSNRRGERTIKISKLHVMKESFSVYYSLPAAERVGRVAIIDIGGRTTNVSVFIDGKEAREGITLPKGTIDYFANIAQYLTAQGGNFEIEEIHSYMMDGFNISDFANITTNFVDYIANELVREIPNLNMYKVKLAGGGAEFFENDFKKYYTECKKLKNCLTANVDGNEQIGALLGWIKSE